MISRNVSDLHLHRLDPGLEDYEKALRMLAARENHTAHVLTKKNEQQTVSDLLRQWKQEEKQKNRPASKPTIFRNPRPRREDDDKIRGLPPYLNPQYAPLAFATLFLCMSFSLVMLEPGSWLHGLFNRVAPHLPQTVEVQQYVLDYASPITDSSLSQNVDEIDTKRFQVLSTQDYVIQPGDTLSAIANKYNLNMDTIISFNSITNPRALRIGQVYKIPNRDGLLYKIAASDSLESIAKKFETTVVALLDANDLADVSIGIGQNLFIPDARMNPTDLKMLLGELFMWPAQGRFTSGYGYRSDPFTGQRRFHNGIDVANSPGTSVKAALAGKVVSVESQLGNYGKVVIIQHPRGFRTLYAHLNSFSVKVGQSVSAGQLIGRMGNTGRSTGNHLHFSVILNGAFVNPLRYLK